MGLKTEDQPAPDAGQQNHPPKSKNLWVLVIALAAVVLVAAFGNIFTTDNDDWYERVRPGITPPDFVFPIVWTILYALIAVSIYLSWISARTSSQRWTIGILFAINLLANALWTPLFFGLQRPALAFADLIVIWATAIALAVYLWPIRRIASILLWPYVAWVSFAGVLNFLVMIQ